MISFIEINDVNGNVGYIKASNVEATTQEPETGITRIFVCTGGFYRVKNTQQEVLAKLRDIEALKAMEDKA